MNVWLYPVTKKKKDLDTENKLVVTCREKEGG